MVLSAASFLAQQFYRKVTEETAQMMEEEVGKHGAIIGRMPLDHDLGLAGLTGTELQMTIAPISEMAQFLIQ